MKYRKLGSLDFEVSALGFGAMRLPTKIMDVDGQKLPKVDQDESIKMIRYAIDNGVNYVDTAFPYMGGESEIVVGKALKDGYREKVTLATKFPMWAANNTEDYAKYLKEQTEKLQTKPDVYLFHGLNAHRLEKLKELNLIKEAEKAKSEGKIKYIGFSFHDSYDVFKQIVDYYDWDILQIQYNYLDVEFQAGQKGLQYAASKGIAVVIMEPIRGGKLFIPENELDTKPEIKKVLDKASEKRSMPDWALQFLWNQPEVGVVLSGMSTMQQVIENVESAKNSGVGILSSEESKTIENLRDAFENYNIVPCTTCGYCLPCPQGVSIPTNLRFLNDLGYYGKVSPRTSFFYGRMAKSKEEYDQRKASGEEVMGSAALCTQCGECLDKCPQSIEIPDEIAKVKAVLVDKKPLKEVL